MRSHILRLSLVGAAILALSAVEPAHAQYPRARRGQFEVNGLDFRPRGAWRQRVANIRAQRQALLLSGNLALLNASGPSLAGSVVTGSFKVPVIPIRYSNTDTLTVYAPAQYADVLFSPTPSGRPYSVKTYYEQLSNGLITMSGTVFPWVTMANTDTYYEDGCNGVGVTGPCPNGGATGVDRFATMILTALNAITNRADSATVWAQYDNDGPDGIPNSGDDDGYVDFVTFLQPEIDGACNTSNIWAHRFFVEGLNGGSPYVTKTVRTGGGFIRVSDYTIQSGQGGKSGCTAGQIMAIGTIAHETGHAFGLPDLYDTQGGSEGVGEWSLMGSGNYTTSESPARMDAWSLLELGWVKADTLKTTGTITLRPVATSDTVLVLPTPTTGEYFLFENRAAVESDSAQMNPGYFFAKQPGMVVWHIDQSRISAGSFTNTINSGSVHGIAVVQADGLNELTTGHNDRGDQGDSYPGSTNNTALDAYTAPALRTNSGLVVPGRVDSIRIDGSQNVLFRFRLERLLKVVKFGTGSGNITSTVTGNLQQGVGVTPGTVVTLTAVPAATGHRFVGWTGDTTSTDSSLVLTMNRNWVLSAQFSYTAPFSTASAASDLLGVPSLSSAQRTLLDQQGNNNGTYDLGDFLAWVTLSGQGVAPELMARLLAAADAPKGVTP